MSPVSTTSLPPFPSSSTAFTSLTRQNAAFPRFFPEIVAESSNGVRIEHAPGLLARAVRDVYQVTPEKKKRKKAVKAEDFVPDEVEIEDASKEDVIEQPKLENTPQGRISTRLRTGKLTRKRIRESEINPEEDSKEEDWKEEDWKEEDWKEED